MAGKLRVNNMKALSVIAIVATIVTKILGLIREMMIFIFPILCQVKTISIILFCRDGILILVFVQMEKVIIS